MYNTSPARPPLKLVEQTYKSSAPSLPTIVEQATPLPPNTATKPHYLLSINTIPPSASLNRIVPTLSSVEQAFLMLPPIHVKTQYATTVKDATPPPLNYINIIRHMDTPSTTPTVSSLSTATSRSRCQHFPSKKTDTQHSTHSSPSDFHQLTNMCWLAITE